MLEFPRFVQQLVHRERPMPAAHEWDRAERAPVVASLAHLEVAHVREFARIDSHARVRHARIAQYATALEFGDETIHLGRAEEEVDLGKVIEELLFVALDHAADGDDRLTGAVLLEATGFDQRIDGLFLRRIDEPAGIDDDDLGGRKIADVLSAASHEAREIALAVDGVLVAA